VFPRTAARCVDADEAVVQLLRAELADVRIISATRWFQVVGGMPGDDTYHGTLAFEIDRAPARLELSLWYGAIVKLDASFAESDRPPARVIDFARRLAACWLAIAGGGVLGLDTGDPVWRPIEAIRDLGPMPETWHGRSFAFDAHLSQLMSEPFGVLELLAPASVLHELEA
jgi:hypothetical protein